MRTSERELTREMYSLRPVCDTGIYMLGEHSMPIWVGSSLKIIRSTPENKMFHNVFARFDTVVVGVSS